jgi:hypothetical protein
MRLRHRLTWLVIWGIASIVGFLARHVRKYAEGQVFGVPEEEEDPEDPEPEDPEEPSS